MDLEAFRWLLTDDGRALLARASEALADASDELSVQGHLREHATPAHVAAALSIVLLIATLALYAVYNRLIGVERMRLG